MSRLIYWLGKYSKWVRLIYYARTGGRTLWGVYNFIYDNRLDIPLSDKPTLYEKIIKFIRKNYE